MDHIEKKLVITNITKIRSGRYGPYVTINGYEHPFPDTDQDTLYMMSISTRSDIMPNLLQQMDIDRDLDGLKTGDSYPLPTGIKVNVRFKELKRDPKNVNRLFVNWVHSIEWIENVTEDIALEFNAVDVDFRDWGISIETRDGKYVDDRFTFFYLDLPLKPSRLMNRIKLVTKGDSVKISGTIRLYYSTYKDEDTNKWVVKPKRRFDSRFDDTGKIHIDVNLPGIKRSYLKLLKGMRENPAFINIVKNIFSSFSEDFVSESEIAKMTLEEGMSMDQNLITTAFFKDNDDRVVFYYLKSLLGEEGMVYYHLKKPDYRYVCFYEPPEGTESSRRRYIFSKLVIYDAKMMMVYVFSSVTPGMLRAFLDRIRDNIGEIVISKLSTNPVKLESTVSLEMKGDKWFSEVSDAFYRS